jgi:hypothetical protein
MKSRKQKRIYSFLKKNRNDYFRMIRAAKKISWLNFLNNAVEKKIFQIYKFTENNRMKKLSSIHYEKKTNIEFEDKCNAFIETMYFASSNIENTEKDEIRLNLNSESFKCSNLIESDFEKQHSRLHRIKHRNRINWHFWSFKKHTFQYQMFFTCFISSLLIEIIFSSAENKKSKQF